MEKLNGQGKFPAAIKRLDQWVGVEYEPRAGSNKVNKIPLSTSTGKRASSTDEATWSEFGLTLAGNFDGIGFNFHPDDGLVGIDLDDCFDAEGNLLPWAQEIVDRFGSYTAYSQSGTGLHILIKATKGEVTVCRRGSIEVYEHSRFFNLTGNQFPNTPLKIQEKQPELDEFLAGLFKDTSAVYEEPIGEPTNLLDEDVLVKAKRNNSPQFQALWKGTVPEGKSHSEADLSLCSILAFYCGNNPEQIDRIFRGSELFRGKWDQRHHANGHTYGKRTVLRAISLREGKFWTTKSEKSNAARIIRLLEDRLEEVYHDDAGKAYVRIETNGHNEDFAIRSERFKLHVMKLARDELKVIPNSNTMSTVSDMIAANAILSGEEYKLHNRIGSDDDAIYYDLHNEDWQRVKVTPAGWEVETDYPPTFQRYAHMTAQVGPVSDVENPGQVLSDYIGIMNVPEDVQLLLSTYLVQALVANTPRAALLLIGQHGSRKTSLAKLLRLVIDPSTAETTTFPKDEGATAQILQHNQMVILDNVTNLTDLQSDVFCRAVTGDAYQKRVLFTDDDDVIYSYKRQMTLTSINLPTEKSDLYDRSLIVLFDRLDTYIEEKTIWAEARSQLPKVLGAVFTLLSQAMALLETTQPDIGYFRMADFARWGWAIAEVAGYGGDKYLEGYKANINSRSRMIVENSTLGTLLVQCMKKYEEYSAEPNTLYGLLDDIRQAQEIYYVQGDKTWPKTPIWLTRRLNELAPDLRAFGLDVTTSHDGGKRLITILKDEEIFEAMTKEEEKK